MWIFKSINGRTKLRQIDALMEFGIDKRNIYYEKVTGAKNDREELQKITRELRSGDTVIVSELTRLSRSTKDLFTIVEQIERNGANIKSLKEAWLDTTTAPENYFSRFLQVLANLKEI